MKNYIQNMEGKYQVQFQNKKLNDLIICSSIQTPIKFNDLMHDKLTEKTIFVIPGISKDLGNRLKNYGYDMVFIIYFYFK